jgi:hypothetical protein
VIEDVAADKGTTQKTDVRVDARPVAGKGCSCAPT